VGNFLLVSSIEMVGEAMALADKNGVSRQQLLQVRRWGWEACPWGLLGAAPVGLRQLAQAQGKGKGGAALAAALCS
jgi:hypothetical protein